MKDFLSQAGELLKKRKQYKRRTAVFLCLAVIVTFGTVTALKLYGQAMTHKVEVLACDYEVHEHTEDCYEEDAEGNRKLVCGYADYVIHVHNDGCYDADGNLVCTLGEHAEHKHTEDCYETERILICGEEETSGSTEPVADETAQSGEGAAEPDVPVAPESSEEQDASQQQDEIICGKETHLHGEECYENVLSCGLEEHTHDDSCVHHELNCELAEHAHEAGCYDEEGNLVCAQEEHAHLIGCYDPDGNLVCFQDHEHFAGCYTNTIECGKENHVHTDECYESTLVCGVEEHEHTETCFAKAEEESAAPAEPVTVVEESSAAPEGHVHTDACYQEVKTLACGEQEVHTHDDSCYTEDCFDGDGNLIPGSRPSCGLLQLEEHIHTGDCFKTVELTPEEVAALNNGAKLHVHEDSCYDAEGKLICGHEATHIHGLECYDEAGNLICGHDSQAEPENEKTCEGSGYLVKVTYPDSAEIPEEAELIARQITEESDPERFAQRQAEAREALANENINVHALFDIGFYVDGQEIEPQDTVNVTIQLLDENGLPEGTPMQIVHFAESGSEVLESGDIDSQGNASFETDSFSEFMLVGAFGKFAIVTGDGLESDDTAGNLICGTEEHTHGEGCYGADGNLTCEKEEHTHDVNCLEEKAKEKVEKVNQLIAGLPSEEVIEQKFAEFEETGEEALAEYTEALILQIQEAWDAYLGLNEVLREYVTGTDYLLALAEMMGVSLLDDEAANKTVVPEYAAFLPIGEQPSDETKNGMVLELLYGDTKSHADKKEQGGEDPNYTRDGMKGNFKLYTSNILGNTEIGDITLNLYFPKEYVDPKGISIQEFPQDQVKHQISQVTEETREGKDYYKISITLKNYIPTGALTLPFDMKFKTAEVPAGYELKIFGTLERMEGDEKKESNPTAENTYRPKYEKPKITKYVNTNVFENMKNDYTRVSAKVNDNGILDGSQYVSFWYKLGDDHHLLRAYDTITLRDTLPTYVDSAGKTQYAVFDADANPGWELDMETDSQGHTVKRVFKVTDLLGWEKWNPDDYDNRLMLEIQQAELKLQFPGCKIDKKGEDGFLTKDLKNSVGAVCEPYATPDESSPLHEQDDTCEDDIIFTLTSQPGAEGAFTKGNSADTVMDTYATRSGAYRWSLAFQNKSSVNLVNVEVGDDVIDDRLKFQSIVVTKDLLANIKSVEAFTYDSDGGTGEAAPGEAEKKQGDIYDVSEFVDTGLLSLYQWNLYDSWTLTLNSEKEYKSFVIHFKDNYTVTPGGKIEVWPFSTFRNPDVKHFVTGAENDLQNVYKNHAYTAYQQEGFTGPFNTTYFLKSENKFKLIENSESIWVEKEMGNCDNMNYPQKDANGNLSYGYYSPNKSYGFAYLYIKGSLDEDKDYDDLRLIDLLPEALEVYPDSSGNLSLSDGYGDRYIKSYETIDNYHNSGRTALIIHLNVDEVRKTLDVSDGNGSKRVYIGPRVRVKPNATPGNFTNDVYLVSEDFDAPPTGHGQQADSLNIQGKGTNAQIRWSSAGGSLQSIAGIYARKYIAKEGSNAWSTSALRLKVGDNFQYKLSMMNFENTEHTNLVVYDVLPRIGDKSVNNQAERGSEFTVNLRGPIPEKDANGNRLYPEGYEVYYTTSKEVYSSDMAGLVSKGELWTKNVTDWNTVTAFKFVAKDGVKFGDSQLDFIIPVKVMDALTPESEEKLNGKAAQDRETGTAVYLEATNSFGYSTATYNGQNVESNWVKAQISFAGFVVEKQDENGKVLPGAEFKLEKQKEATSATPTQEWETIKEKETSDANGKVSFKNLTVGTYRLTETKAPDGYKGLKDPITVTITFDDTTMEYTVTSADLTGSGTGKNPFVVINETFYELPETGGIGSKLYTMAGAAFLMLSAGFLYKKKFRERRV